MELKIPIEEKIRIREILLKENSIKNKILKKIIKNRSNNQHSKVFVNHKTPNRSIKGFGFLFRPKIKQLEEYHLKVRFALAKLNYNF